MKYVAVISPVREVILVGTADLAYWRERLAGDGLFPFRENGHALLTVSVIASSFRGIAFREFTISVAASNHADGRTHDGFYLVHAFNSSRLLALAERTFFRTPYYPAEIVLNAVAPVSVRLARDAIPLYEARMGGASAPRLRETQDWRGRIFLPSRGRPELFHAQLAGLTDIYPFVPEDTLAINPHSNEPALDHLLESGFAAQEWRVRTEAVHARSRTYRRD